MRNARMTMVAAGVLAISMTCLAARPAGTQDDLLKQLPKAKLSLADGIKQLSKAPEEPISAKFELDDNGKLSLSVYTAEKGLGAGAEDNVLKEFAGSPESSSWKPEAEIFKDVPHVSRASMQLTLMSTTKLSLLDILAKAKKDEAGMAYSINPVLRDRKAVFVVLVANQSKSTELVYDLLSGERVKK